MNAAPRFRFFVSSDASLLQQMLAEAVGKFRPEEESEKHTFWGDEGLGATFWEHLTLQGLFARPKVLVIRNAQAIPAAGLQELSLGLQRASDTTQSLVCLEVAFEKGAFKIPAHIQKLPCYLHAQKNNWIHTIQPLTQNTLPAFIKNEASRLGLRLEARLIPKLASLLPPDAATVRAEMGKLALTTDKDGNVPEAALLDIEHSPESDIFRLLHIIETAADKSQVWTHLQQCNQSGDSLIFAFLASLIREARALWQLCQGETPALPPSVINQKKALAQTLGLAGITRLWDMALSAEWAIKSGEQTPEQAFDLLVANLCQLFAVRRGTR